MTRASTSQSTRQQTRLRLSERAQRYAGWLAQQARQEALSDVDHTRATYQEQAAQCTVCDGQQIMTFAPFRDDLSARRTLTRAQSIFLTALLAVGVLLAILLRLEAVTLLLGALTLFYMVLILFDLGWSLRAFFSLAEESIDAWLLDELCEETWPRYTILCPLYKEAKVISELVRAIKALDYPEDRLQVLFLTEADDHVTRAALSHMQLPTFFQVITVPDGAPRTKPRACNYGLLLATGDYTVIYDAEDIPDPRQLREAVLTFANHAPDVACVQAKLSCYNAKQNLLTRLFAAEYATWFYLILPGMAQLGFTLPLGGTSNHFRTSVLRALGGWDAFNVTEDCDLGLRLVRYGLKTVILSSETREEASASLPDWIKQRSRWIKGYMQTYLVHMRHPLALVKHRQWKNLLSFHLLIGTGTVLFFINPFFWALFLVYFCFNQDVMPLYHELFPSPILYLSAFCLIFGNFFYIYLHLLGCVKTKQEHLLPTTLFMPIYWALMCLAGGLAFWELIVRPHHWQKTEHGLFLKSAPELREEKVLVDEAEIMHIPVISPGSSGVIPTITGSFRAIATLPMPAISYARRSFSLRSFFEDKWLLATIALACACSIGATIYFFHQHNLMAYSDSLGHLQLARAVFDSATPGIAQLGDAWLPLQHILMWPFIWNDYLWRTGLAGTFVAMPCYILATIFTFLTTRRLTKNNTASFIGTCVFALNPNILYLQSTPMGELTCMATFIMTLYFFMCWAQTQKTRYLILAGISAFFATLVRYDGWALFCSILVLTAIISYLRKREIAKAATQTSLFFLLGGFGIFLWFFWSWVIYHDPLYFQHSIYSAKAQQEIILRAGRLFTYHDIWQSLRFYIIDVSQTVGVVPLIATVLCFAWFCLLSRNTSILVACLVLFTPFVMYVFSLYTGEIVIWVQGATPVPNLPDFNARYGTQCIIPLAIMLALGLSKLPFSFTIRSLPLGHGLLFFLLVWQIVMLTQNQGPLVLKDFAPETCLTNIEVYLAQHYQGGKALEDIYVSNIEAGPIGLDEKDIIQQGNEPYWGRALRDPAAFVNWVVINPSNPKDQVAQHINPYVPAFYLKFRLVALSPGGVELYHRIAPPLAVVHSIPPYLPICK